jgi:hypothetical protein
MKPKHVALVEWVLGALTVALAIAVWWQVRRPLDGDLLLYDVFPLFGLLAFGLMWTHFIVGAVKRFWNIKESPRLYHQVSSYTVLACILAHPLLLWIILWVDDFGLPPMSQYQAYGGTMALNAALFVAPIALGIFLLFELKRVFKTRDWWPYVEMLQLVAMVLIFVHALNLGGELAKDWYEIVWWMYGITLLISAGYSLCHDLSKKEGTYAING